MDAKVANDSVRSTTTGANTLLPLSPSQHYPSPADMLPLSPSQHYPSPADMLPLSPSQHYPSPADMLPLSPSQHYPSPADMLPLSPSQHYPSPADMLPLSPSQHHPTGASVSLQEYPRPSPRGQMGGSVSSPAMRQLPPTTTTTGNIITEQWPGREPPPTTSPVHSPVMTVMPGEYTPPASRNHRQATLPVSPPSSGGQANYNRHSAGEYRASQDPYPQHPYSDPRPPTENPAYNRSSGEFKRRSADDFRRSDPHGYRSDPHTPTSSSYRSSGEFQPHQPTDPKHHYPHQHQYPAARQDTYTRTSGEFQHYQQGALTNQQYSPGSGPRPDHYRHSAEFHHSMDKMAGAGYQYSDGRDTYRVHSDEYKPHQHHQQDIRQPDAQSRANNNAYDARSATEGYRSSGEFRHQQRSPDESPKRGEVARSRTDHYDSSPRAGDPYMRSGEFKQQPEPLKPADDKVSGSGIEEVNYMDRLNEEPMLQQPPPTTTTTVTVKPAAPSSSVTSVTPADIKPPPLRIHSPVPPLDDIKKGAESASSRLLSKQDIIPMSPLITEDLLRQHKQPPFQPMTYLAKQPFVSVPLLP